MAATNQEWFSAGELAGLPGLPGTERAVRDRGRAWPHRTRSGRGGGREYHISSLPQATREHLAKLSAQALIAQASKNHDLADDLAELANEAREKRTAREEALAQWNALPNGSKKQRALAREWLLRAALAFAQDHGSKDAAFKAFALGYQQGDIAVPPKHRELLPKYDDHRGLSAATLWRWDKAWREHGRFGLVDAHGKRAGSGLVDSQPDLLRLVVGAMVAKPHITANSLLQYIPIKRPDLKLPSLRRLQIWMRDWKASNAQLWSYMTNPDQWKSAYMPAVGSAFEQVTGPNQVWEMDGTPGDWGLTEGRFHVLTVIDLYTRRTLFLVTKTSKAMAVCTLLRRAILTWGVPQCVRVDNGKEFVSAQFEGSLRDLEIHLQLCVPFASEEKGTVERVQETMSHGILDLLPGFLGHNVAERKVIEARKSFAKRVMTPGEVIEVEMTAGQLQKHLDDWALHVYGRNPHSGLNGLSPWEAANASTDPIFMIENERALDMLLQEIAGSRTVGKKGIRLDHHLYDHPDLFEFAGQSVHIKYDPDDIGKVYVYGGNPQRFICIAECAEILGISRAERAAATKAAAKKRMAQQSAELREFKKDIDKNIAQVVIDHRKAQSENIIDLPRRSLPYSTPALEAAAEAAKGNRKPETGRTVSDTDMQAFKRDFEQLAEPAQKVTDLPRNNDPIARFKRWQRIDQRIQTNDYVSQEDRDFHKTYQNTREYQVSREFYSSFETNQAGA